MSVKKGSPDLDLIPQTSDQGSIVVVNFVSPVLYIAISSRLNAFAV